MQLTQKKSSHDQRKKHYISEPMHCPYMHENAMFRTNLIAFCCKANSGFQPSIPRFPFEVESNAEEVVRNFWSKRACFIEELYGERELSLAKICIGCRALVKGRYQKNDGFLKRLSISVYPAPCQAKCIFCDVHKNPENFCEEKIYSPYPKKIVEIVEQLDKEGYIHKESKLALLPSEISIMPYKELFLSMLLKYKGTIFTNGFIFDKQIAKCLENGSEVLVALDAGTPKTYKLIKGFENHQRVLSNIRNYRKYGEVWLKYVIVLGVNDNAKDIAGFLNFAQEVQASLVVIDSENFMPLRSSLATMSLLVQECIRLGIKYEIEKNIHPYYNFVVNYFKEISLQDKRRIEQRRAHCNEVFNDRFYDNYEEYRNYIFNLELSDLIREFNPQTMFCVIGNDEKALQITSVVEGVQLRQVSRVDTWTEALESSFLDDVYLVKDCQSANRLRSVLHGKMKLYEKKVISIYDYMSSFYPTHDYIISKRNVMLPEKEHEDNSSEPFPVSDNPIITEKEQIEKKYSDLSNSKLGKLQLKIWELRAYKARKR